jgi:hypothetical protein
MIKAVFVGDEPSRLNVNSNIAFVGSKSFATLVDWINHLRPDFYVCKNSHTEDDLYDVRTLVKNGFKAIALGNKASVRLEKLGIKHYKMPHPSGLNRKLNDPTVVFNSLICAFTFLRED